MNVAGIQSGMIGMAIFDIFEKSMRKVNEANKPCGSPLVAAAARAFEQYLDGVEVQHTAQIAGLAAYALQPGGKGAMPVTLQEMAPFLALNLMA